MIVHQAFEKYNYQSIYFAKPAIMSLYAIGRSSGFIIDNSETTCEFLCVEDSFIEQKFIRENPFNILKLHKDLETPIDIQTFRKCLKESSETD